jgi:hypothetical protein
LRKNILNGEARIATNLAKSKELEILIKTRMAEEADKNEK